MKLNQLMLNAGKTVIMTFGTPNTVNKVGNIEVHVDNKSLEVVDTTKYLGVMLDQTLSFEEHVTYIKRKCSSRLRMLAKLRPLVGQETSMSLYKI